MDRISRATALRNALQSLTGQYSPLGIEGPLQAETICRICGEIQHSSPNPRIGEHLLSHVDTPLAFMEALHMLYERYGGER